MFGTYISFLVLAEFVFAVLVVVEIPLRLFSLISVFLPSFLSFFLSFSCFLFLFNDGQKCCWSMTLTCLMQIGSFDLMSEFLL